VGVSWHEQSDSDVTAALRDKQQQLEAADGFGRLGLRNDADTKAVRAAFLEATKTYHPSRFARRPEEVRDLANEVFLCIKEAYVRLSSNAGRERERKKDRPMKDRLMIEATAVRGAGSGRARRATPPAGVRTRATGTPPGGPATNGAQPPSTRSASRDREERFAAAVAMLSHGDYDAACDGLQKLGAENPNLSKFQVYLHYARGKRHAEAGAVAAARAEFEQALTLHPEFFLVTKAIAQLPEEGDAAAAGDQAEQGSEAKKPGLFSRLFRK